MPDPKKVMVVDDSEDLVKVISDFLIFYGYEVSAATRGEDALDLIKKSSVDAVISDIHMEGIDGFHLMMKIKEYFPGTPVVLITGFSINEAKKLAFSKGADAFIAKPFHLKELKEVLDNLLGK